MYILKTTHKDDALKNWHKPEILTILKKELENHIKVAARSSSSCWFAYGR